jgi:hypothetical protein
VTSNFLWTWRTLRIVIITIFTAGVLLVSCADSQVREEIVSLEIIGATEALDLPSSPAGMVFFGHRSVGDNLLEGLIENNFDNVLAIREWNGGEPIGGDSLIVHYRIGENGYPDRKIRDFHSAVDAGYGDRADLLLMKLCYLDIDTATDVETVFGDYQTMIAKIKADYPRAIVAHVTVPLTTLETGWKACIKSLIGRSLRGREGNVRREQYNALIRKSYGGVDPIFDLAYHESISPDGIRKEFKYRGDRFYALVDEYSSDGGHLNELGRRYLADAFLQFILKNLE